MLQILLKVNRGMKKRPVYGGPLGWRGVKRLGQCLLVQVGVTAGNI